MEDDGLPATEALRTRYKPSRVRVLFVGEAPPAGGTFFYAGNSQVYRYLKEALLSHLGDPDNFLQAFADCGYFLDDLVLTPVDTLPIPARRPMYAAAVPLLAQRLSGYQPAAVVSILKRISSHVEEAISVAGLLVPHHSVSFPGTGRQGDFRREIAAILPHLS